MKKDVCLVCSYGGSGSKVLTGFLSRFFKTIHLHDGNPPKNLTIPGFFNKNKSDNTFGDQQINPNLVHVFFIFRSPVDAYLSRGINLQHCKNVDGDHENHITDPLKYIEKGVDTMKYREHFDNYTKNDGKNYKVICINYHKMWDNLEDIFNVLNIPLSELDNFPKKKETKKDVDINIINGLEGMYSDLIKDIENFPTIKIV